MVAVSRVPDGLIPPRRRELNAIAEQNDALFRAEALQEIVHLSTGC
jgi:hypothetical protein